MSYIGYNLALTDGQRYKLELAVLGSRSVGFKFTNAQLSEGDDELPLTQTQIKRINKKHGEGKGMMLTLSRNQILAIRRGYLGKLKDRVRSIKALPQQQKKNDTLLGEGVMIL